MNIQYIAARITRISGIHAGHPFQDSINGASSMLATAKKCAELDGEAG